MLMLIHLSLQSTISKHNYVLFPYRVTNFDFSKPLGGVDNAGFTSPQQQVLRLKEEIKQKVDQLDMLRNQLLKAQEENYRLVLQMQGFVPLYDPV